MAVAAYRESILSNLLSTLQGISTDNGFNLTPLTIERGQRTIESTRSFPALYLPGGGSMHAGFDFANDKAEFRAVIAGYVNNQTNAVTELNQLIADVEYAVLLDPTRGGYAISTDVESLIDWVLDNYGQFEMTLRIEYIYPRSGG